MLKGFSVPLTHDGKSALANLPPWHYSSDCMAVEYWADPAAGAGLPPPGVIIDEKSSRRAPPPPWHYSSDCMAVEYWADPAAAAALLPPGVIMDEKSGGRGFFWFLDWQFTASNDELTDPARYQYREAFVLIEAIYDGAPINYCPFIFVDNDAAMARGWSQGFPKKL